MTESRPAPVVAYVSAGSVVVIGPANRALAAAQQLPAPLRKHVVATDRLPPSPGDEDTNPAVTKPDQRLCHATVADVRGFLGNFRITIAAGEKTVDLDQIMTDLGQPVDIVLDLSEPPLITSEISPVGYFAPGTDTNALHAAMQDIPKMVGSFEKPKYFDYDPHICAHSRSGVKACTRCIDACPTDAIISGGDEGVVVDPHLCQGAGACATACPTGAIRYSYPQLGDSLEQVARLLGSYLGAGGRNAQLFFHSDEYDKEQLHEILRNTPENVLPVAVEDVGQLGMDIWLAALAYGAASVNLLLGPATPPSVISELKTQLSYARALLEGMGYPATSLNLVTAADAEKLLASEFGAEIHGREQAHATFAAFDDKRTVMRLALDHLYRQAPAQRPMITLPTGAPFGEVLLADARCTLCMACVSQCPGNALLADDDAPRLKFVEQNCVQCGICARVCPENAIAPTPRYLFDDLARRKIRLLKEEQPFLCISCGKPFATASVIQKIIQQLRGNPNFGPGDFERLKMCEDCRVKTLFEKERTQSVSEVRQ